MKVKLAAILPAVLAAALFSAAPARAQYFLYNKVLELDGAGDFIVLSATEAPGFTTEMTVDAWILTSVATGDQAVVSKYNNSTGTPINNLDDSFQLTVHDGKARFQISLSNNSYHIVDGQTCVADGSWHHLAGTFRFGRGGGMKLYVDGVFAGGKVLTGSLNGAWMTALRIGAAGNNGTDGFFFNGYIDEVRLWFRELPGAEISENLNYPIRDQSGRYPIRQTWRFNGSRLNGSTDTGRGSFIGDAHLVTPFVQVPLQSDSYLRLDGDQEYVRIQSSESYDYWPMTVEAWVRPLPTGSLQSVVSKFCHNSDSLTDDAYFLGINSTGTPRFQVSTGGTYQIVSGPTSVVNNGWHHLAGVYDGSQIRLYVDGTLRASAPLSGWIPFTSTPIYIGASREGTSRADADFFRGDIDDVRIWYAALSQSEIQARMNSCWLSETGGLLLRYSFEGDLFSRVSEDGPVFNKGLPSGTAERLTFVGRRGANEGSCP